MEIFTKRLIDKAASLGFSSATISKKLKVSRSTTWQWFQGVCMPRAEKLKELADLLEVSVSWLTGGPIQLDDIKPLTMEQINAIGALAPKEKVKPRHEDVIKKFQDKELATELNQILVEIEKHDPDIQLSRQQAPKKKLKKRK